ncbi:Sensitive to high expression protein 9 [Podosphaera aphanis]|nr:Sensitive to high expression protein 9 [Podosphaera aphanis]
MQPQVRLASKLFVDHYKHSFIRPYYFQLKDAYKLRPSVYVQRRLHSQLRRLSHGPIQAPQQDESHNRRSSDQSNSNTLLDEHGSDLPSAKASRRHDVTKRISYLMDNLQGNIFIASQRINDLTGYSSIEALKKQITILETKVQDAQHAVQTARLTYKTTVTDRASTQREVTTLLARKDAWTPSDLERFTALYRMDHSNEQAVQEAATRLADAESNMEHLAHQLRSSILARYHEEQIWSDKIRRMSTWGTWVLMGVNVLLFLVFQFGFEPWRRKRLIQGFEEKVREALEQDKRSNVHQIDELLDTPLIPEQRELKESPEYALPPLDDTSSREEVPTSSENTNESYSKSNNEDEEFEETATRKTQATSRSVAPWISAKIGISDRYKMAKKELDEVIEMRNKDVLIVALEGAAAGATVASILITFFRSA